MIRRRSHNEGSIYEAPYGRWRAQVSLPSGRRISKTFDDRKAAAAWRTAQIKALQDGSFTAPERITLGQLLDRWMRDVGAHTLRPKTIIIYESAIRVHIGPALGHVRLNRLSPADLQQFYSAKLAEQLSPTTVRHFHALIHRVLRQAVKWGLVARNVADAADPPRRNRPQTAVLTPDQARTFLEAAREDRLFVLYLLAITTGMRQGELLGLHWANVDLEGGTIRITTTMQRLWKRGMVEGEPKTRAGRRSVAIASPLVAALREHRRCLLKERLFAGGQWQDHDLVFPNTIGKPLTPTHLCKGIRRHLEAASLPRIRFHDLRHTAATLMLAVGIPGKVVQETLGHADIGMTLNTYTHLIPELQRDGADRMAKLLTG